MDRARLTIVEIPGILVAVAVVVGLYPVYNALLSDHIGPMGDMTAAAAQVIIPATGLLLLALVAGRAAGGLR